MKKQTLKCPNCRNKTMHLVTTPYSTEIKHDGRAYRVSIESLEHYNCSECGDKIIPAEADVVIWNEVRNQAGLFQPHEIVAARTYHDLTQKKLAELLGVAESTICRWETGAQVQQISLDRFMRTLFANPDDMRYCAWLHQNPTRELKDSNPYSLLTSTITSQPEKSFSIGAANNDGYSGHVAENALSQELTL